MIAQTLQTKIGEAMKAGDTIRLSTLRMLLSEFNNEKINLQKELEDDDEERIIRKEVKKRKEAIEIYTKAGEQERLVQEKKELAILQEFLSPEMSEDEVKKIIDEVIEQIKPQGMQDMGKVMGAVRAKATNADGALVASVVKQKLEFGN
jgi:uncharacterized protein YqeY